MADEFPDFSPKLFDDLEEDIYDLGNPKEKQLPAARVSRLLSCSRRFLCAL